MGNKHIIGGEFGVSLQNLQYVESRKNDFKDTYAYASGRSALYYVLLDIQQRYGVTKVYLPDYLCSSVLFAAKKSGMEIIFYALNNKLEINFEKFPLLENEKAAILLINYFGLLSLKSQIDCIHSINRHVIIIEDDVQAFYEFCKPEINATYKFTSLRKAFPCPDGGLVKTNHEMKIIHDSNKFHQYKLAGSILKNLRKPEYYDDDIYLQLFVEGENRIDGEIRMGMSKISRELISKIDFEQIALIRQSNAKKIVDGLESLGIQTILPVDRDKIPLFIPIWLDERDKVRKRLFQEQVFCPIHWPYEGMKMEKGMEMAKHELSIIIDQRYTNQDMDYILNILEKCLK